MTRKSEREDNSSVSENTRPGFTRRRLLGTGAVGVAAATIVPSHVLGSEAKGAPNQRPSLAAVGVGGGGVGQVQGCGRAGFQVKTVLAPIEWLGFLQPQVLLLREMAHLLGFFDE